jgi:hypothetical protein
MNDKQHDTERTGHGAEILARLVVIVLFLVARHHGNESGRKSAFCEEPPQHVRDPLGYQEGIHDQSGTEKSRKHDVPDQAENSGQQRHAADDRGLDR